MFYCYNDGIKRIVYRCEIKNNSKIRKAEGLRRTGENPSVRLRLNSSSGTVNRGSRIIDPRFLFQEQTSIESKTDFEESSSFHIIFDSAELIHNPLSSPVLMLST